MDKKDLEKLEGCVEGIIYRNAENGYCVFEISSDEGLITVVGEVATIDVGEQILATGNYGNHPSYGTQFKAVLIEKTFPATASAIIKYLSSGAIKGIGHSTAKKIVDLFGNDTFEVIEKTPEKLTIIRGVSLKKAQKISEDYKQIFGIRAIMAFLAKYNIDPHTSIKIWKLWGMLSSDVITDNPYLLCNDMIGMGFEQADEIAKNLNFSTTDKNRLKAGVLFVLQHNVFNGHTCLPTQKLLAVACELLEITTEMLEIVLEEMLEEQAIFSHTAQSKQFLYLPYLYQSELFCAGRIRVMLQIGNPNHTSYTSQIKQIEQESGILYADLQKKAIETALNESIFILTGGPGTGKTTTLNAILNLLEQNNYKVTLAAPTGRAAKRMSELTGRDAKTIHRLLEVDFKDEIGKNKFKRHEKNPLPFDAIIIDEMSMIDTVLFESLLKALKISAKLIIVGDPDQLPCVGAGNVLKDIIDSDTVRVIHLDQVFRQAAKSSIVTSAHAIVKGERPDITKRDSDFFFLKQTNYTSTLDTVVSLCQTRLPNTYHYSPLWDIQVIAPTRVGQLGTVELNRRLQLALNPEDKLKKQFKFGQYIFREGDKIMQIKNNYDITWYKGEESSTGIFNGDIGIIELIDKPSQSIIIKFDDKEAHYTFDMADEIELAYAITVHKSQGSEFQAVIMPLMNYNSKMYYRNLLYTGVTRSKSLLILLGQPSTLKNMIDNDRKTLRYTNLTDFLRLSI
ncbi:MAG: ATP-dependent RecD-like DNA helicase [Oscillospiraceae bacterium]